jgi:amphi-Trp domain-containing protein
MKESVERDTPRGRIEFNALLSREEAVAYFESIVDGLRRGSLRLNQGTNEVTLAPTAQLEVSVEARVKDGKERLIFDLSWRTQGETSLQISFE